MVSPDDYQEGTQKRVESIVRCRTGSLKKLIPTWWTPMGVRCRTGSLVSTKIEYHFWEGVNRIDKAYWFYGCAKISAITSELFDRQMASWSSGNKKRGLL